VVFPGVDTYQVDGFSNIRPTPPSIQAIILIFFLFTDVILDIIVLFTVQKPWATWGLVLRFGCGITYITHFLLYVGLGGVFPEGYTYWGLTTSSAELVVYILLCVEG
jgi:hypothetical protein